MKLSGIFINTLRVLIIYAIVPWATAQQGGTSTGSPNTAPPKSAPKPAPAVIPQPDTRNFPQQQQQQQQQQIPQILFVSGRVVLENGSAPQFGTTIERDCGGSIVKETTVDTTGYYSFQLGSGQNRFGQIFPDASQGIGQDPFERDSIVATSGSAVGASAMQSMPISVRLFGCELRAQLAGYRSTSVRLEEGSTIGQIQARTIVMYPIERVQGTMVSVKSLRAPKAAKKNLERARKAFNKKEFDVAEKSLKSAVEIYPEYAEAWLELGRSYQQQLNTEEARKAYAEAINADKMYVEPYIRMAKIFAIMEKWQEAANITDQALDLDPITFPEGYFLNALAYYNLNKLDLAERVARRGQQLDFDNQIPHFHLILANILARKHDRAGSIEEMRKYLKVAPKASDADLVRARVQESENIAKAQDS